MNYTYVELVEIVDRADRIVDRYRYASKIHFTEQDVDVLVTLKKSTTMTQEDIEGAIASIVSELDESYDFSNIVRIL